MKHEPRPLAFFEPVLGPILNKLVKQTRFRSRPGLAEILQNNPRLFIVINHSSPLSWLPAIALLTSHACAKGGGSRRPMGVMDRFFFAVPGLRALAHQLTQTDHPLGFHELVAKFRTSHGTDIVIFPEGSNCFFGDPNELQPFRSPRFVELAVRSETPILLCAHRGSESWAKAVPVADSLIEKVHLLPKVVSDFLTARLRETGRFTIPYLPKQLDHFEMICELYEPKLKLSDLNEGEDRSNELIRAEAELVHQKLQSMLDEIDSSVASSRT